ncbi:A/G-specific adenine glycosylase [Aquimonas voraii]|uniref:Adenine DNA glycosylase n=1 Tax=Aquimonas voraii TaxID=265719 RepID=A0A1G7A7P0_9GAMM|nr:A/G-specific adenine glycosylase [Aquimonas voraii]SDE10075.1 A/G-specific DNA-adenine glycosylase [Aquimonas voraii]
MPTESNAAPPWGLAARLLDWQVQHGRHDLPWQHPRTPYRVWLSEVMLQQTQVGTVISYFERFVEALPSLPALAAAPLDQVLGLWSGLGYYSRARNLHRAAQRCAEAHAGELPTTLEALMALPGIGRSTAGAILAQAHGLRFPILDGNVRRVLARYHGIAEWPGLPAVEKQLWRLAESHLPDERLADYTQAQMDLGATVCTRGKPACLLCPLRESCAAHAQGLTGLIPAARPRKETPVRSTRMLLLVDAHGRVLLERRPQTGVWAELWSLPECAGDADAEHAACALPARLEGQAEPLPGFRHTFSHYHLDVQPLRWRARAIEGVGEGSHSSPQRAWFDAAAIESLGLPAPVRKLLGEHLQASGALRACGACD